MGGVYDNTTLCQGQENYQEHCTHNGPSATVWLELLVAAGIIFGLFSLYVKCSSKHQLVIEWNASDEDSTDIGSSYDNVDAATSKRRQPPYHHINMHPALTKSQKSLQAAKQWVSARLSHQSLPSAKVQPQPQSQQQPSKQDPQRSRQNSETSFYTAPTPSLTESKEEHQKSMRISQTALLSTPTVPEKETVTETEKALV